MRYFAFPATEAERTRTGDSRASIEARYSSHADYIRRVEAAARQLVTRGFLLEEDVKPFVALAASPGRPWPCRPA